MTEPVPADDELDHEFDDELPVRRRAQYLTPLTALLMAVILGGVGFYVGIRVEKSKTTTTTAGSALAKAFASAATSTTGKGTTRDTSGFAKRFGTGDFAGAGAAGGTTGTVSSVDGDTIYVKETDGNTVKVKLSSVTTITKSESVSKKKLYPGDAVVIAGGKGSDGTVEATSVTDSGASTTSTSSSTSSSSTSGNSTSAISSLFGSGT